MAREVNQDAVTGVEPNAAPKMEHYLRISAVLMIVGLLIEAISLNWAHPTAFLVFMFAGGTMMGIGILLFLVSLVSHDSQRSGG